MTAAPSPDKSSELPPEAARQAIYPMRTQPRPIRVTYMIDPAAFACAVLPEAYRTLVRAGAGLAIQLTVGTAAVGAGTVGDEERSAVAAMSGHDLSLG